MPEIPTEEFNEPLYIADAPTGSRPHKPEQDAPTWMEMNKDPRIYMRFEGEEPPPDTIENAVKSLNPKNDAKVLKKLLDPNIPYKNTEVLQRAIEKNKDILTGMEEEKKEMMGWVAFYRPKPRELRSHIRAGLIQPPDETDQTELPVLEVSYSRHKDMPAGIMEHGIRAEIYRLYRLTRVNEKEVFEDKTAGPLASIHEAYTYKDLCPLRLIAVIDTDNPSSKELAAKLGFVEKGNAKIKNNKVVYELDWDKFMEKMDEKVSSFWEAKLES